MGTVELTGFEMISSIAFGQFCQGLGVQALKFDI
jgi:hypothetical protein